MDKFYQLAHTLMQEMSGTFNNERARVSAFEEVIHQHEMWNLETVKKKCAESDCSLVHRVSGTKHVLVNFELKNELCCTLACPEANEGYLGSLSRRWPGNQPSRQMSTSELKSSTDLLGRPPTSTSELNRFFYAER